MHCEIIEQEMSNGEDEKCLYLDGKFKGSWPLATNDSVIYESAINTAYMLGKKARSAEFKQLLEY